MKIFRSFAREFGLQEFEMKELEDNFDVVIDHAVKELERTGTIRMGHAVSNICYSPSIRSDGPNR